MVVSMPLNFSRRICIHLKVIETGLAKCRVLLDNTSEKQNTSIIDLMDSAEETITTAKSKLQCMSNSIELDSFPHEEDYAADDLLRIEIARLATLTRFIVPKNLTNYGTISKETLGDAQKTSENLQTTFDNIKLILEI